MMHTVGDLKRILNLLGDHVPVVVNVHEKGDGRKRHSVWAEDFTTHYSTGGKYPNTLVIAAKLPEIEKAGE